MTSLAHLLGMIYDLRADVERRRLLQQCVVPLTNLTSDLSQPGEGRVIEISHENGGDFKIQLDVASFDFNDLTVSVSAGEIKVSAEHNEQEDECGFIARQFTRRFILPDDFDPSTVSARLTSDGKLTVRGGGRKMTTDDSGGDRFIPHSPIVAALTEDELS